MMTNLKVFSCVLLVACFALPAEATRDHSAPPKHGRVEGKPSTAFPPRVIAETMGLPARSEAPTSFVDLGKTNQEGFASAYEKNNKAFAEFWLKRKRLDEQDTEVTPRLSAAGLAAEEELVVREFLEKTTVSRFKGTVEEQKAAFAIAKTSMPLSTAALLDVFENDGKNPAVYRIAEKLLKIEKPFNNVPEEYGAALEELSTPSEPTDAKKVAAKTVRDYLVKAIWLHPPKGFEHPRDPQLTDARVLCLFALDLAADPAPKGEKAVQRHDWLLEFGRNPLGTARLKLELLQSKH